MCTYRQILKKKTQSTHKSIWTYFCDPEDGRISVSTYDLHNTRTTPRFPLSQGKHNFRHLDITYNNTHMGGAKKEDLQLQTQTLKKERHVMSSIKSSSIQLLNETAECNNNTYTNYRHRDEPT
jgi:hypothetical protein